MTKAPLTVALRKISKLWFYRFYTEHKHRIMQKYDPNDSKPYLNVPKSYLIIQKYGSNKSTYSDFVNPNVVNLPLTEQCLHFPFFRTSCKVLLHWGEPKTSLVPHMKGIWNHTFFTLFVCPFLFLICKKQKSITLFSVFLSRNSTSNTK